MFLLDSTGPESQFRTCIKNLYTEHSETIPIVLDWSYCTEYSETITIVETIDCIKDNINMIKEKHCLS